MAKRCQITGKTVMSGNNVSHANARRVGASFEPAARDDAGGILGAASASGCRLACAVGHGGLDAF